MKYRYIALFLLFLLALSSCKSKRAVSNKQYAIRATEMAYKQQKREFRAAWIPTAWRGEYMGKSSTTIQQSLRERLDLIQQAGFNAVIFQVRSEGDAW